MTRAFTVTRADRAASTIAVGAIVYDCKGWDYGCANDDTRNTGIEHTSVTLDPNGGYPFFTIPKADLKPSGVIPTPAETGGDVSQEPKPDRMERSAISPFPNPTADSGDR